MDVSLDKIINGSSNEFKKLFDSFYWRLFHFAKEYVIDEDEAHNQVQDTFMKLWEMKDQLPEDSNIKSFLFVVTRNNCLNYLKNIKVKQKYLSHLKKSYEELSLNYHALEKLNLDADNFNELEILIKGEIERLPSRCKEVFIRSRVEGLSNKEIAKELEISEKAVEAQITRGLKKLRKAIHSSYPTDFALLIMPLVSHEKSFLIPQ